MDLLIIIGLLLYFVPTVIGWKKKDATGVLLLNLFLGWTLIGWGGALVWAFVSPRDVQEWLYVCPKCGYRQNLNQIVRVYVCPQCKTETPIPGS